MQDHFEVEISELRNTLAWMDLVMANLSEGVIVLNQDWQITFVNDILADLIGQIRVLLLGKKIWDVLLLTQDGESIKVKIDQTGIGIVDLSKLNGHWELKAFKTSRIFELNATYIPHLEQVVCVLSDVTLETRAMDQLSQLPSA